MGRNISKSRFTKCAKCPKSLWLAVHEPELAKHGDSSKAQAGTEVGELARGYFGDYELIEFESGFGAMLKATKEALESGVETIAEAAFSKDGMFCMADILHRNGDAWDLVEVKSSTMSKGIADRYLMDIAFQHRVLERCGIGVGRDCLMHPDPDYVREGGLDPRGFFRLEDVTEEVASILGDERKLETQRGEATFSEALDLAREMCRGDSPCPETGIGEWCVAGYDCEFKDHCWSDVPDGTPLELAGMAASKRFALYREHGTLASMPDSVKLNERQRMQVEAARNPLAETRIAPERIAKFVETVTYPVYYLDFETVQPIVPLFDGTRPYQQVPTQYSLHVQEAPHADADHREFLATEGTDPRRALAERLVADIPEGACSMAWNMSFEKRVIRGLAQDFPDLAGHLMSIHKGMVDLIVPFRKGHWCSPEQHGSFSIKKVLPAMFPNDPELDYGELEGIHNGGEAMDAFLTLALKSPAEIAVIREQLLRYCELDTWAMVRIFDKLVSICEDAGLMG